MVGRLMDVGGGWWWLVDGIGGWMDGWMDG